MKYKKQVNIFAKAQVSAFLGGIIDYLVMISLSEFLHIHYTISILFSGMIGAVANFYINKYWTYQSHQSAVQTQLAKFVFVVVGSILLKSGGTYLVTSLSGIDYKITRLIVDLFVSLGFNFVLQKYWVFKKAPEAIPVEKQSYCFDDNNNPG
ncbi:MAG: GtrA family protein [Bacteroidota bacterium]